MLLFGILILCHSIPCEGSSTEETESVYSNHVWMYYDGEMVPILSSFIEKANDTLKDTWFFHFTTPATLPDFLNTSLFPQTISLYVPQIQSDLIRLRLLDKYGGWWIDVSTIVNSDEFMQNALNETEQENAVFFGYCFLQCPHLLIENGIFYATVHSPLIQAWDKELTKALIMGRENYIYALLRAGINLPTQLFTIYPFVNPYFAAYAAERAAISRVIDRKVNYVTKPAIQYIYKLFADCSWNKNKCIPLLRNEIIQPKYQITKLWTSWRRIAWPGSEAKSIPTSFEPRFSFTGNTLPAALTTSALLWLIYYHIVLSMLGSGDRLVVWDSE